MSKSKASSVDFTGKNLWLLSTQLGPIGRHVCYDWTSQSQEVGTV